LAWYGFVLWRRLTFEAIWVQKGVKIGFVLGLFLD